MGPQHAGIGLDYIDSDVMAKFFHKNKSLYSSGDQYPSDGHIDMLPPGALPEISNELTRRGYSEADVRAIIGENYLRVLQANA